MPLGRNVDEHFAKTPTPHFPRSRFDMGIHKRLQTQGHGRLYPFFIRMVYPGDTWQMDLNTFVRTDTSLRVPLDDIFLDTYFFFVPLRILDENFPKILGEGEPSDYDDVSYGFPLIELDGDQQAVDADCFDINFLLGYMNYSQGDCGSATVGGKTVFGFASDDEITVYPLAAYYKIYNDWFRDENVDSSIPYKNLYGSSFKAFIGNDLFDNFNCLKVNKFHDYFSSAVISPQKGPAVTIPLGTSAPVGLKAVTSGTWTSQENITNGTTSFISADGGSDFTLIGQNYNNAKYASMVADLSQAAGTINELRLSFAIQALYERRGRFGTRYIETIRGQWGIEVPDSFFLRPEYLGGSRVTLNNVPVLSTENSSQLGQMSGNSSTLANGGSFTKTFIEYGYIIGLSCTRVKHSYTQGKKKELWMLKTQLDLYNPVFANIGMQPISKSEIFNDPESGTDDAVFGYQEAWADLRSDNDSFAGLFGMLSSNSEIKNKWHYGDYYVSAPVFSASWL